VISLRSEASAQRNTADPEPQLGVGDEVMLPKYGAGRIEEIEAALRVRFPTANPATSSGTLRVRPQKM